MTWQTEQPWAWIAGDIAVTMLMSVRVVLARRRKIGSQEVPKVSLNVGSPVDRGGPYHWGAMRCDQTLAEAFAFAFAYGTIMVSLCDEYLLAHVDPGVEWILTLWLGFLSMLWMCAFATQTIHTVTAHTVHFVYYGCGFAGFVFYSRPPATWLLVEMVLLRLGLLTTLKYSLSPNYPWIHKIVPLFVRRDCEEHPWILKSAPGGCVPTCMNGLDRSEMITFPDDTSVWDKLGMVKLFYPLPVFEVLNGHASSHISYGMLLGMVVTHLGSCVGIGMDACLYLSVVFACIGSILLCVFEPCWYKAKFEVLHRFFPRAMTIFLPAFGAGHAAVKVWQLQHSQALSVHGDMMVMALAHSFHIVGFLLVLLPCGASTKYHGSRELIRMVPLDDGSEHESTIGGVKHDGLHQKLVHVSDERIQ